MNLKEFDPVCEAVLARTEIERPRFPVVDFHTHMGKLLMGEDYQNCYDTAAYRRALWECGVVRAVNLDGFYGVDLEAMNRKIEGFADTFVNFMWIDFTDYDKGDFARKTESSIRDSYEKGCRGIKLWKDISLYKKDMYGKAIRTDDPRFDVIYDTAASLGIPVLMHIADPVAFFKAADGRNERFEELEECPNWNFSDRSRFMGFEELLEMQENMVRSHPETIFVIAHVGSYAENLGWVGGQLDRYPNLYVDIAARIAELGRVPYSARRFFTAHADRILFGTDSLPVSMGLHRITYRFLETEDEYFPYQPETERPGQGRWRIYGLGLEDEVLRKVYYQNACRLLHLEAKRLEEEFHEAISEC